MIVGSPPSRVPPRYLPAFRCRTSWSAAWPGRRSEEPMAKLISPAEGARPIAPRSLAPVGGRWHAVTEQSAGWRSWVLRLWRESGAEAVHRAGRAALSSGSSGSMAPAMDRWTSSPSPVSSPMITQAARRHRWAVTKGARRAVSCWGFCVGHSCRAQRPEPGPSRAGRHCRKLQLIRVLGNRRAHHPGGPS
jgi:hypothetical protein